MPNSAHRSWLFLLLVAIAAGRQSPSQLRPKAPKLSLPTPYAVIDFGDIRTSGRGAVLDVNAQFINGCVLARVTITNDSGETILIPPIDQHMFDFDFWEVTAKHEIHAFRAYSRDVMVFEAILQKEDLLKLEPANSLSLAIAIPNVHFPRTAKAVLIKAKVFRANLQNGKDVEFSVTSKRVRLAHFGT